LNPKKFLLLLIIVPAGGPGVQRWLKFVKLPRIWRSADRLYSGESYVSYCGSKLVQDVSDQAIILKQRYLNRIN
jgi:hypothetical protein